MKAAPAAIGLAHHKQVFYRPVALAAGGDHRFFHIGGFSYHFLRKTMNAIAFM